MSTIEKSSGNVYGDLGHADASAMFVKAQLAQRLSAIILRRKLTQREAADIVGIPQPKLSNILRGQFRGVSETKLLEALRHLGQDVQIVVKPARRKTDMGGLTVAFA